MKYDSANTYTNNNTTTEGMIMNSKEITNYSSNIVPTHIQDKHKIISQAGKPPSNMSVSKNIKKQQEQIIKKKNISQSPNPVANGIKFDGISEEYKTTFEQFEHNNKKVIKSKSLRKSGVQKQLTATSITTDGTFTSQNPNMNPFSSKRMSIPNQTQKQRGSILFKQKILSKSTLKIEENILDESYMKNALRMPDVQGDKIQLQDEIGHYIFTTSEGQFYDEQLNNQDNDSFYKIVDKDSIEIINDHYDRCPLLALRKGIMKLRVYFSRLAFAIITNNVFETFSIMVIVLNSISLALQDPTAGTEIVILTKLDVAFQIIYTCEMMLKISALGFVLSKNSYLRDAWNVLDFTIVVSGYLPYLVTGGGTNISALRSFRVLRPLRTISGIEGLRVIVGALISSMPLLRDTMLVILFFFIIFAIGGVQLFAGSLKNRCIDLETGQPSPDDGLCGGATSCVDGFICGKSNRTPNSGNTNFDDTLHGLLVVFFTVTLQGWTEVYLDLCKSVGTWVIVFFIPIVFIGAFFLLNLTIAVIKSKYSEEQKNKKAGKVRKKKKRVRVVHVDSDEEEKKKQEQLMLGGIVELTAEQKQQLRDKIRIENLLKRLEVTLKQKEIHDKLTPRDFLISPQRIYPHAQTKNKSRASRSNSIKDAPKLQRVQTLKIQNKNTFFKLYGVQEEKKTAVIGINRWGQQRRSTFKVRASDTINEAEEEYYEVTRMHDEEYNQPKTAQVNKRIKDLQPINRLISKLSRGKHAQNQQSSDLVPNNLEKNFIIDRDVYSANEDMRMGSKNKLVMSGMVKIQNFPSQSRLGQRQASDKELDEMDRKMAAYLKIKENFKFLDFLEDENEGGDELSERHARNYQTQEDEDDLEVPSQIQDISLDNLSSHYQGNRIQSDDINQRVQDSNMNNQGITTINSSQSRSYVKMNTLRPFTSRVDLIENKPEKEYQEDDRRLLINRKKNLKRLQTHFVAHQDYQADNDEFTEDQEVLVGDPIIGSPHPKKRKAAAVPFKSKAQNFLRNLRPAPDKRKLIKSFKSQVLNSLNQKRSKSANVESTSPLKLDKSLKTSSGLKQTIRLKYESRKQIEKLKADAVFSEREALFARRRNKYFSKSIKNIGKTRDQLKNEMSQILEEKRMIKLRGGFESILTQKDFNKKLLMRSGSVDYTKSSLTFGKHGDDLGQDKGHMGPDEEENLDVAKVLLQRKKKILLKEKKFEFASAKDVFELREEGKEVDQPIVMNKHVLLQQETQEEKDRKKEEREEEEKKFKPSKIKGYQKKIVYGQKVNHDELIMEDMQDSDDNQDIILKRLEQKYNYGHRSHIYVTGTLSLVLTDSKVPQKIMAKRFFESGVTLDNANNQSILSNGSNNQSSQVKSSSGIKHLTPRSASAVKRQQSKYFSPTKVGQSSYQRTKSLQKQVSNISKVSSNSLGAFKRLPTSMNTNQQTDKQILSKLNHQMKKSRIFQSVNFRKLPTKIIKKKSNQVLPQSEKDKIVQTITPEKSSGKAKKIEDSDSSDEGGADDKQDGDDFFLEKDMECRDEVRKAKDLAIVKCKDNMEWSGQDILTRLDPYKARLAMKYLNAIRVWPHGFHGYIKRGRILIRRFVKSSVYENFFILCVIINTVVLTLDHYGISSSETNTLTTINFVFTVIFTIEMGLKLIAIGVVKYMQDKMNYLDGAVVILSLVEVIISSGGALSAFRTVRIFRTFRVLRIARLLKSMKSMMNILFVIQNSITSFIYLTILMFLFVFIYSLLGMQIYGGHFDFDTGLPRTNFDSFNTAFITSFTIISLEKWYQVFYDAMAGHTNFIINVLYFVSWIFIGNFMLLNLFLAIMLDSFAAIEQEEHLSIDQKAQREAKEKEELDRKEGEDLILAVQHMDSVVLKESPNKKNRSVVKKKKKKKKLGQLASNILDESIEIDLEVMQTKKEEKKDKPLYEGIECQRSLYIFDKVRYLVVSLIQKNPMRMAFYRVIHSTKFESLIMGFIFCSTVKLIMDTYLNNKPATDMIVKVSSELDYVFTTAFACEAALKIISLGFIQDQGAYIRESWSQLDFFIVTTSLIDASLTNINLPIIKILRLLRILRPLRFISHNSSMKTVVVALLQSLFSIFNVVVILSLIYLMFAILGVNFFEGKFQYCTIDKYILSTTAECVQARGQWLTYDSNFDSVPNGMLALFIAATKRGWLQIMFNAIDTTSSGVGPTLNNTPVYAYFFIFFLLIGSFFMMNLFVGVLFMNFSAAQREEKESQLMTDKESKWVDMMNLIVNTKPEFIKVPKNRVSEWAYRFTRPDTPFDITVMVVIILNMFSMAISYEGESAQFTNALDILNYCFTSVFFLECILKLIGQSSGYFKQNWNRFDFFVVCSSLLDIIMSQLSSSSISFLKVGPQLLRVLRILRLSRLFRLLNKYRGLQALIQTIQFSMGSLLNVLALLILVLFIYSILGVFMFNGITRGVILDDQFLNFNDFGSAMVVLFKMSTGEDWPLIMYDTMNTDSDCVSGINCGTKLAPLYFLTFTMICNYVMLNLFILVIIQQFELYYLVEDNILQKFRDDLSNFKSTWSIYSREFEGMKVRSVDLTYFFKNLKGNLSMKDESDAHILRNIVKMNMESDEHGFVYFNEVLFKSMKRKYAEERTKNKALIEHEVRALEKLQTMKQKMIKKQRHDDKVKAVTVNPFLTIMYKSMTFKSWVKIYRRNEEKRRDEKEYEIDRDSSAEEFESQQDDMYEYVTERDESVGSEDEGGVIDEEDSLMSEDEGSDSSSKGRSGISGSQQRGEIDQSRSEVNGRGLQKGFTIKLQKVYQLKDDDDENSPNQILIKSQRSPKKPMQIQLKPSTFGKMVDEVDRRDGEEEEGKSNRMTTEMDNYHSKNTLQQ